MAIKAKCETTCQRCERKIEKDSRIVLWEAPDGERVWVHEGCGGLPGRDDDQGEGYRPRRPASRGAGATNGAVTALQLEAARQALADEMNAAVDKLCRANGGAIEEVEVRLKGLVDERAMAVYKGLKTKLLTLAESVRKTVVEVRSPGKVVELKDEVRHECFEEVLRLAARGYDVLLWGPSGSGKTHLARQVAEALGRPFGFINGSGGITERHFTGTSVPNLQTGESVFVSTPFVKCVEGGGVFLIDEGDALDPNVWVCLNGLLANGVLPLPLRHHDPQAVRHKDFVLLVSANTVGAGADRDYTARAKLDLSTIDRFAGCMVHFGYSPKIEQALCPDERLLALLLGWRKKIADAGLARILSTRFVARAAEFAADGESDIQIAERLTKKSGWTRDEAAAVIGPKWTEQVYGKEGS